MPNNDGKRAVFEWRRTTLGLLALTLLIGWIQCWIWSPESNAGREWHTLCARFGPLLAILWLAYPEVQRIPRWFWLLIPIALFLIIKFPKMILLGIPVLFFLGFLKMRMKRP
jgi:hypothetical protein